MNMTLGNMIEALKAMPPKHKIKGLGELHSYRGYYSDLAFEPTLCTETVKELLERCNSAIGKVFIGYKGGDFEMGAETPLWLANYGECGLPIMAINDDGSIDTDMDE